MDFAYIVCVFMSAALFLPDCFGQDGNTVESEAVGFAIKIIPESESLSLNHKSNIVITCQSSVTDSSDQKPLLHWEINDTKITATGRPERITVESMADDQLRLRIENIQNGDEGIYRCVGTLGVRTDSRSIRIEVYESISISSDEVQVGIFGQTGQISCVAKASPWPLKVFKFANLTKIVNSEKYTIEEDQLVVRNLTFDDARDYLCDVTVVTRGENYPFTIKYQVVKIPVIEEDIIIDPINPKVGDDVTLTCKADGVPEPTYQFKKGGINLTDADSQQSGVLTITNLKQDDEGTIECEVSNQGGSNKRDIFLDVKVPPTIRSMPNVTEAVEGEQKQVTCFAEGDPAPTITWQKEGQAVYSNEDEDTDDDPELTDEPGDDQGVDGKKSSGKTMNFASIRPDHAGTYICTVVSYAGSASKTVVLEVKYKPHFETGYTETKFYGWKSHTSNLTCLASANEIATIQWYKTSDADVLGTSIQTREPYSLISPQEWPAHYLSSRSLMVTVNEDDSDVYGDYQCEAANSLGSSRRTVTLIKAVPPEKPSVIKTVVLSTMITLEVDAPGDNGGQPILGYFYSYHQLNDSSDDEESYVEISEDTTTNVELKKLVAKTSYVFKVSAKTAVGRGEELIYTFDTKEVSRPLQLNMTSPREGSDPTSIKVVWSEPDNGGVEITQYVIKYKKVEVHNEKADEWQTKSDDEKNFKVEHLNDPSALSYIIGNLERNSFYDIRITAINTEGESTEETKIIKTSEGSSQVGTVADGDEKGKDGTDDSSEKDISDVDLVVDGKKEEDNGNAGDTLGRKSDSDSTASGGIGTGPVIGIVVGLLIIIVIIAIVIFFVFKRKPELVGRLRGHLGGKGGEEERGNKEDGKDPAEEEKLIKKDDIVKVENETEEGKPEQASEEQQEEFEPDSKPDVQPTPEAGAKNGTGDKSPELSTPAPTTEIKITPETPEKPENPAA